jgi:hypothetical protein
LTQKLITLAIGYVAEEEKAKSQHVLFNKIKSALSH